MSITKILLEQIIIMFLLAGIGYALFKTKKITAEGSKYFGNLLIYIVLPCVIINSFLVERTPERILGLFVSALMAALILGISIIFSRIIFKKDSIACFAAAFSNAGFIGIPLIIVAVGSDSVFYIASFIAFLNLLQWTYGVFLMSGHKNAIKPCTVLKAPFMIAIEIGLLFFFSQLSIPHILTRTLSTLSGVNTPLAMFTIGIYLAQTDLKKMLTKPKLYRISAVRLILIPIVTLLLLCFLPQTWLNIKIALLIASACPVGSNVAVYAQLHNQSHVYAVETVVISTLLSILTIPTLVFLANWLW
ncbi:AEC family transporter [Anaerosporobacter sp.]|uniref:AEC family transporter n=1 Tax=Anaerosporobacter sp. TaxID=1872529 RepID=UPI00286EFCF6|nr:AEC family transporter [Anaerosporobacter sp.]